MHKDDDAAAPAARAQTIQDMDGEGAFGWYETQGHVQPAPPGYEGALVFPPGTTREQVEGRYGWYITEQGMLFPAHPGIEWPLACPKGTTFKQAGECLLDFRQRILLGLYHGVRCKHVDGICPDNLSVCKHLKDLSQHVPSCRTQNCQFKDCAAARLVWTHFRMCKNGQCELCDPLRKQRTRVRQEAQAQKEAQCPRPSRGEDAVLEEMTKGLCTLGYVRCEERPPREPYYEIPRSLVSLGILKGLQKGKTVPEARIPIEAAFLRLNRALGFDLDGNHLYSISTNSGIGVDELLDQMRDCGFHLYRDNFLVVAPINGSVLVLQIPIRDLMAPVSKKCDFFSNGKSGSGIKRGEAASENDLPSVQSEQLTAFPPNRRVS